MLSDGLPKETVKGPGAFEKRFYVVGDDRRAIYYDNALDYGLCRLSSECCSWGGERGSEYIARITPFRSQSSNYAREQCNAHH